jgi:hypothetical protein
MSNNKANYTPDADIEENLQDDSYATSQNKEQVPVQGDNKPVEDPVTASSADSDQQLGKYYILHVNTTYYISTIMTSPLCRETFMG